MSQAAKTFDPSRNHEPSLRSSLEAQTLCRHLRTGGRLPQTGADAPKWATAMMRPWMVTSRRLRPSAGDYGGSP